MPYDEVMPKFKRGELKSGGSGKTVTNPKQAVAIMMSEKREASKGKKEYQAHDAGGSVRKDRMPSPMGPTAPPKIPDTVRRGRAFPMGDPPPPGVSIPIPNTGGKGTLIVPDRGREEWEPQSAGGRGGGPRGSMQPLQRDAPAMGGATGEWKKGGSVKKPSWRRYGW